MVLKSFADKVLLPSKKDVLRVHLYLKLLQFNVKPFENHIDIILELYLRGGYHNAEEQADFIDTCIRKKLKKSNQSVRNVLSKYVTIGVFDKPKNTVLVLNERYLPTIEYDRVILQHQISHAK